MKKVFELSINGKFAHYIKPSEIALLKWEEKLIYTLTPVTITAQQYKIVFNQ
jgi:hypothetical protein